MSLQSQWQRAAKVLFVECDVAKCIEELRAEFSDVTWCKGSTSDISPGVKVPVDRLLRSLHQCAQDQPELELRVTRQTITARSIGSTEIIEISGMTLRSVLPSHKHKSAEIALPEDLEWCISPRWLDLFLHNFGMDKHAFYQKLSRA